MTITEDLLGKRLLVRSGPAVPTSYLYEVVALEISPSGQAVRLRYSASGHVVWKIQSDLRWDVLMEVLPSGRKKRK